MVFVGVMVEQTLVAKVRNLEFKYLGHLMDKLQAIGGVRITNMVFDLEDKTILFEEMR